MGKKRGRAEGSFVRETSSQVVSFYSELVQDLKAWQAPAPKVHSQHVDEDAETSASHQPSRAGESTGDLADLPSSKLIDGDDDAPPAVAVPLG